MTNREYKFFVAFCMSFLLFLGLGCWTICHAWSGMDTVPGPTGNPNVAITWPDNPEPDVAGYRLYCMSYEGIYTGWQEATSGIVMARTDCHTVDLTAYDTSGNESEHSEGLIVPQLDVDAPGKPGKPVAD